jgi:hypothetical protein
MGALDDLVVKLELDRTITNSQLDVVIAQVGKLIDQL